MQAMRGWLAEPAAAAAAAAQGRTLRRKQALPLAFCCSALMVEARHGPRDFAVRRSEVEGVCALVFRAQQVGWIERARPCGSDQRCRSGDLKASPVKTLLPPLG